MRINRESQLGTVDRSHALYIPQKPSSALQCLSTNVFSWLRRTYDANFQSALDQKPMSLSTTLRTKALCDTFATSMSLMPAEMWRFGFHDCRSCSPVKGFIEVSETLD